jgi:hypothetical protein
VHIVCLVAFVSSRLQGPSAVSLNVEQDGDMHTEQ